MLEFGVMSIIVLLVSSRGLQLMLDMRHKSLMERLDGMVGEQLRHSSNKVIVLNHTNPAFEEMDKLLSVATAYSYNIVLFSQPWMIKLKAKKWFRHSVINGYEQDGLIAFQQEEGIFVKGSKGKVYYIKEMLEVLREDLSQKASA
ncbi:hypothetical protein PaecuDRAFT_2142 [Paenibacillus curdlanolyticus YK9]|uniref:Uncharacterized protein n=1 Tax=Paenibacillus curdlanolyticus YK9 TaxID=717606 RepID=E0I908_9BACL|nr:hypothetical protein [Paenibacillus curdlanolyticus]EFM10892.1 hypothetical protein PaecuDRAFT_2142 [Paenibacillus curdlanolyticus YK9]